MREIVFKTHYFHFNVVCRRHNYFSLISLLWMLFGWSESYPGARRQYLYHSDFLLSKKKKKTKKKKKKNVVLPTYVNIDKENTEI